MSVTWSGDFSSGYVTEEDGEIQSVGVLDFADEEKKWRLADQQRSRTWDVVFLIVTVIIVAAVILVRGF